MKQHTDMAGKVYITFRIGKKVNDTVEWCSEEYTNLVTNWGMQAIYRYPIASLSRTILIGTSALYPKVELTDLLHQGTEATSAKYAFVSGDVGKTIIHPNGTEAIILSVSNGTAYTEDISITYSGPASFGLTSLETLVEPISLSTTVDPTGIANEKVYLETTGLVRISNVRCVIFPGLVEDTAINEVGWTPSTGNLGLNSKIVGRKVVRPVNFLAGEIPYIQVGIHRVFDCNVVPITGFSAYQGTGHHQLLIHQPQFDDAYYSTIGSNGETILPTKNSLMEPYRVYNSDAGKFLTYANIVDYENNPTSFYGETYLKTVGTTGTPTKVLALSETRCVILVNGTLTLYDYNPQTETLSATSTIAANSVSGVLGLTSDGCVVVAGGSYINIYNVGTSALSLSFTVGINSSYGQAVVTESDLIILSNTNGILVYRWQDTNLLIVGEYPLVSNSSYKVEPDYGDRFIVHGVGIVSLCRIDDITLNTLVQFNVEPQIVNSITKVYPGVFHVGGDAASYLLKIAGNTIVMGNESINTAYGKKLVKIDNTHWYNYLDNSLYLYNKDTATLELTTIWRSTTSLSSYNDIIFTSETGSYLKRYVQKFTDRVYFTADHLLSVKDNVILTSDETRVVKYFDNGHIFVATPYEWIMFNENMVQQYYVVAPDTAMDAVKYSDSLILVLTPTKLYLLDMDTLTISSNVEIGVNHTRLVNLNGTRILASSSTAHLKLISVSGAIGVVDATLDRPGQFLERLSNNLVVIASGTAITIVEFDGDNISDTTELTADSNITSLTVTEGSTIQIVFTTQTGLYTAIDHDGWNIVFVNNLYSTNVSLHGDGEDLLIVTPTGVELCAIHGSQLGRYGYRSMSATPGYTTHMFEGNKAIIEHMGILCTLQVDRPTLPIIRNIWGTWHIHPDSADVYGVGFSNNNAYDPAEVEWYLSFDTPLSYISRKVLKIGLSQVWTRQTYVEDDDEN